MEEQESNFSERRLLKMFKKDVCNNPILSKEEEYILAKKAQSDDQEAINLLIESNLRFVVHTVFKFWYPGLPLMDLIAEGCLGMIRATKKYDPERGFRFITYAEYWISQRVRAEIKCHRRNNHDSLDVPVYYDHEEMTYADSLVSDCPGADQNCFGIDIRNLLDRLTEREKKVIDLRFWHDKTLEEVGDIIGLSENRIRQIEGRALRRLRLSIYEECSENEREALLNGNYFQFKSF